MRLQEVRVPPKEIGRKFRIGESNFTSSRASSTAYDLRPMHALSASMEYDWGCDRNLHRQLKRRLCCNGLARKCSLRARKCSLSSAQQRALWPRQLDSPLRRLSAPRPQRRWHPATAEQTLLRASVQSCTATYPRRFRMEGTTAPKISTQPRHSVAMT